MNYGAIKGRDIANGPGVRVSLFVSGCTHHCPGCFNPDTWDFAYGAPFTPETVRDIIEKEIGATFVKVLTHAGVYKRDAAGRAAFLRFVQAVNTAK